MPDDVEYTESGQPRYRHGERKIPEQVVSGDGEIIDAIDRHISEHLADVDLVWHEIVSDLVHIDVHVVNPGTDRDFYTLITSGMSESPMNVPTDEGVVHRYAELCVLLPADWPLTKEAFEKEENYFPIRWLKQLARLPHVYDTWLGYGHTVPNGEPAEPLAANNRFMGWIVLPSPSLPESFMQLKLDENRVVDFYVIVPLYQNEMDYKLKHGTDALIDLFIEKHVTDVVDINRPSVIDDGGKQSFWKKLFRR